MKKFLSVLMAATMLVGVMALTGCGGDTTEPTTDEANNQSEPASTTATDLKTVTEGVLIKKDAPAKKAAGVFGRLLAAGERLMQVIRRNEGGTNKDLAKFADQINSLCDKWDR